MTTPQVWVSATSQEIDYDGHTPGSQRRRVGEIDTTRESAFFTYIQVFILGRRTVKGGYRYVPASSSSHDDQAGPYLVVHNVLNDTDQRTGKTYGPWRTMHLPVPDKLWLTPEAAERKGGWRFLRP